jgi:holliday junction DNA helicase RuvB
VPRESIIQPEKPDDQQADALPAKDSLGKKGTNVTHDSTLPPGTPDDENDFALRPKRIADMVGQREVIEVLHIAIDAARKRNQPLGHILFDGPPGLGKTTFATCIPREMGVSVQMASGPALKAPKDIIPYLTNLEESSVLFVDEIHRLPKAVEEYLYTAMEDFRIDIVLGEGVSARTLNLQLKPFTLIGATTRAGMLSGPLRDRFQIRQHLGFYSFAELKEIVTRNAQKLNVPIESSAAAEIATRSRGTPRIANNRLLWIRDYATSKSDGRVTLENAMLALEMTGIDSLGLDRQDRRYIETIIRVFNGGPAGIEAIAHTMNVSSDTLVDEVEPFLLRSELIIRTSRGRCATSKAFQHLKLDPPSDMPLFG